VTRRETRPIVVFVALAALFAPIVAMGAVGPAEASSPSTTSSTNLVSATAHVRGRTVPTGGIHTAAPRPATPQAVPGTATPQSISTLQLASSHCQTGVSTASQLQSEFNRRGPVWGGGDGAEPVAIDGGRTLWLFGDTFIGGGNYYGALNTSGIVHNSFVIQYGGSCFAYLFRKNGTAWSSAITDISSTDWYWPLTGNYDSNTGILSIVASHVHAVVPGDQFGWVIYGVDVLHYRVEPSIQLLSISRLFTYHSTDPAQFGTDLMVDGDSVDFYGCAQQGTAACYLAQTDLELDPSSLEYSTGTGWSTNLSDAAPIEVNDLVGTELHVAAVDDGYVASNQVAILGTTTNAWWGPTPTGPFSPIGTVVDTSSPPVGPTPSNWFTYGGRVIQSSAGAIAVVSVNTWDDEAGTVAGVYGPRFVALDRHLLNRDPFGHFETLAAGPDQITVSGWALDPDQDQALGVEVLMDGALLDDITTNSYRPDVASAFPDEPSNLEGFGQTLAVPPGTHSICLFALNHGLGASNASLGCKTVTVGGVPFGHFESSTVGPDDVTVSGWAIDPDTASSIAVHVYVDGHWTTATTANGNRPDVGTAFPAYGSAHGFSDTIALSAGTHQVCLYAINAGNGTWNPTLGCRSVTVGGVPFGHFEAVSQTGTTVTLSGWAIDPDTALPISVHVYVDGRWTTAATADADRPDVGASFPPWGDDHGFDVTFTATTGHHQVCVYAINWGSGTWNPRLACRST
jgi:hypothetical protein